MNQPLLLFRSRVNESAPFDAWCHSAFLQVLLGESRCLPILQIQEDDGHNAKKKSEGLSSIEFFTDHKYRIEEGENYTAARDHRKKGGSGELVIEVDHQKIGESICDSAKQSRPCAVTNGSSDFRAILFGQECCHKHQNSNHCQRNDHKQVITQGRVFLFCFLHCGAHSISKKGQKNENIPFP